MSVSRPSGTADDVVVIRLSVWNRLWPLLGAAVAFIAGVRQISDGHAPWYFLTVAVFLGVTFESSRPVLHVDASGVKVARRRRVPWSEVAELHIPPDGGRKHPFVLQLRHGARVSFLRKISPDDVRRIENLLVASRSEGEPPV